MIPALNKTLAHLFRPGRSNNHRPRLLHPELLFILSFLVVVFGSLVYVDTIRYQPLENILGYASNINPEDVVRLTNSERAKQGLHELVFNSTLSAAAQAKGQDMFAHQYWAHTSPAGKEPWDFMNEVGYTYRVAGENLARDFMTTTTMVDAWMASPTHRANIVNARYTEIGIAVINGHLQGVDTTLVVQMFGTPRTVAAAPATTNQAAQTTGSLNAQSQPPTAPSIGAPTPTLEPEQTPAPTNPAASPASPIIYTDGETELVSLDASFLADNTIQSTSTTPANTPQVLAQFLVPIGEINPHILFSPRELAKAFALAISILLLVVLVYDLHLSQKRHTVRLVGKNLGHIMLFLTVIFLLIFLKGGVVG